MRKIRRFAGFFIAGCIGLCVSWIYFDGHIEASQENPYLAVFDNDGFSEKTGIIGHQSYIAVVQRSCVVDNKQIIFPHGEDYYFLTIDLKYNLPHPELLKTKLLALDGITRVEVGRSRLVVERKYLKNISPTHQLWPWDEIWEEVLPIVQQEISAEVLSSETS